MARFRTNAQYSRRRQQRDKEPPPLIESDLSAEMAISHQELEAILRLLGDELDDILLDAGRN
jgi:hypothetical protein